MISGILKYAQGLLPWRELKICTAINKEVGWNRLFWIGHHLNCLAVPRHLPGVELVHITQNIKNHLMAKLLRFSTAVMHSISAACGPAMSQITELQNMTKIDSGLIACYDLLIYKTRKSTCISICERGYFTMDKSDKRKKITQILAEETGGKSYKAHKYSLDAERSFLDYNEDDDRTFVWKKRGETEPPTSYKSLEDLARKLATRDEQVLSYFLDGSRHVYKVDEMAYAKSGDRSSIYPIIAGQVGVGICKRVNKRMVPEIITRELVISVPSIADPNGKGGFFEALSVKLNESNELARIKHCGWRFATPIAYDIKQDDRKFEDRGTAQIQGAMIEREKEMVKKLVRQGKLNQDNYLIKDGSLEYRLTKSDQDSEKTFQTFKQNYNWVIGLSKTFNPEACFDKGKANPGYIADIPLYSRTPVAYFGSEKEPLAFAVWYVRLRDKSRTRTPFDGILKVEKILVRDDELKNGMDTETVDRLTALIINERNPTCYGADTRWANHIYPVYLTERYVKSQYLSTESFLHLF